MFWSLPARWWLVWCQSSDVFPKKFFSAGLKLSWSKLLINESSTFCRQWILFIVIKLISDCFHSHQGRKKVLWHLIELTANYIPLPSSLQLWLVPQGPAFAEGQSWSDDLLYVSSEWADSTWFQSAWWAPNVCDPLNCQQASDAEHDCKSSGWIMHYLDLWSCIFLNSNSHWLYHGFCYSLSWPLNSTCSVLKDDLQWITVQLCWQLLERWLLGVSDLLLFCEELHISFHITAMRLFA